MEIGTLSARAERRPRSRAILVDPYLEDGQIDSALGCPGAGTVITAAVAELMTSDDPPVMAEACEIVEGEGEDGSVLVVARSASVLSDVVFGRKFVLNEYLYDSESEIFHFQREQA